MCTQESPVFSCSYLMDGKHKISKVITFECSAYFLYKYVAGMNVDFLNCMSISRFNNGLCSRLECLFSPKPALVCMVSLALI